jgi:hypothetical protein
MIHLLDSFSPRLSFTHRILTEHLEDGGVTLNGAKVVKSLEFADATKTGIIHEVDGFISPTILWRYADQREWLLSNKLVVCQLSFLPITYFSPTLSYLRELVRIPGSS